MSRDFQNTPFGYFFGPGEFLDDALRVRWVIPTDTNFSDQWHLLNTGQSGGLAGFDLNVVDVWDDYTGEGILVGVVDDGVSYVHPDLDDNYDTTLDQDAAENDGDAAPTNPGFLTGDNHGTAVAGVIAAENNGIYSVGVAYDATIVGLRIGFTGSDGPEQPAEHFNYAVTAGIDILNNSWGYGGFFDNSDTANDPYFADLFAAMENAVENGRDGLGTLIFFASGNEGDIGQDANYHNLLNSRYSFTIGATNRHGEIADFSTPGAPVLVVAPGEEILTTDREEGTRFTNGYNNGYTTVIDGTSFSSPAAAGVAALVLEANSDLGYRDVQEIFALSAYQTDASHSSWEVNGADNWNGGGMHTSRWYGFGMLDAHAAVRFAETWTDESTFANEASVSGTSNTTIPMADLATITDTITIANGIDIDHVEVTLDLEHTAPVDLIITLISPDGTESQLVVQPGVIPGTGDTDSPQVGDEGVPADDITFTLTSTEFWGETGEGTWTIRIEDTFSQDSGQLNSWTLSLYGDAESNDDTYFFTDEFATFAAQDGARQTLNDTDGTNTINAAPVTTDMTLDLSGGVDSIIAGTTLTLGGGTVMHNAYGGDGNDTIIGNAFDNHLYGGRGDDDIDGGAGTNDTAEWLTTVDQFTITVLTATSVQIEHTGASGIDEGTDTIDNVEFFDFGGTIYTLAEVIVLGGGSLNEVPVFTSGTTANYAENGVGVAYDADATDADSAAPTYAITGGADAALFSINSITGEVTFDSSPDFENPQDVGGDNVYEIEITASSDGDDTAQTVEITVTNENDNAPVFTSGAATNFEENGTGVVYDASATDADGSDVTFSLGGLDAGLFSINSITGEVTFDSAPDFESPQDDGANNVYDITVIADDGVNTASQNVEITVTNDPGAVTFTSGTTADFAENGSGVAYDADATNAEGPAPTFAITGGADASKFLINSITGEVTFEGAPDFETPSDVGADNTYEIEITAVSGTVSATQTVEITVTNENDNAPVFTSGTATSFAENGTGTVYDASATDADIDGVTFSLAGTDAALFSINSATGDVTFNSAPDFENPQDDGGNNVYDIEVIASDGVNTSSQNVEITVTDDPGAVNFTSGTSTSVAENTAGTVYDADATNPEGAAPTYAITGGADAADFTINSITGEVSFVSAPDFENPADSGTDNTYDIEITAVSGTLSATQTVEINVTNENDNAPVFTSGTATSFAENGTGTVYDASATDADIDGVSFSLAGTDAALFSINSATGDVTFNSAPDFENPQDDGGNNVYDIEVIASDGVNTASQNVEITVTDDPGSVSFTSGTATSVAENTAGAVYDANATNPEGVAPTYAITGGTDAADFTINSITGEVSFVSAPDFENPADSGADNTYDIEITAVSGTISATQTVEINVTNENDNAPVFTSGTATSFTENDTGTVYDANATDADGNDVTFSLAGTDAGLFSINSITGEVTFDSAPDFENPQDDGADNVYDITVMADDGVNTASQNVEITVTDVPSEFNVIDGDGGPNELTGTPGADQINGLGDDDIIDGLGGIDDLNGGDGNDIFLVGVGDGPDDFDGGDGNDTIVGVEAGAVISFSNDFGPGNSIELITNDLPGEGTAYIDLTGTPGNDVLNASALTGNYNIDGLEGDDTILGSEQADIINPGEGRNALTGNGGTDIFLIDDGSSINTIYDFTIGEDVLDLSEFGQFNDLGDVQAAMTVRGAATTIALPDGGIIRLRGVNGNNLTAADFVFAGASVAAMVPTAAVAGVTIGGTEGSDSYDFSATELDGIESIDMGAGADTVVGSADADTINGDAGDDTIEGADGNDTIDGGADSDTAVFNGNLADYTPVQVDGDSLTITDNVGTDGTDTIHNVEFFEFADQTVSFEELLGLKEVPEFTSGTTATFAENGVGVVYDADATDADSAAPTYAITGGADSALFTINSATGEVSFVSAPDFENPQDAGGNNVYDIEITASSDGDDTSIDVAITVTNENDNAPVFTSGTATSVVENSAGTVYDANATDADGNDVTFSLGGLDAGLFSINSITGEVTFDSAPDFENPQDDGANNVYDITVIADDGVNTASQNVEITVTDDPGSVNFSSGTVANFSENGVGVAYDADAANPEGAAPTFAITGGADAADFTINSITGEVSFVSSPDFEAPADSDENNVYEVEVTAISGTLSATQTVEINVTNENDNAPVFTSGTATTFAEEGTGTAYQATATDADGNEVTFSISGGADAGLFSINSITGEVTFDSTPDFETPLDNGGDNIYDVEITATDGFFNSTQTVQIEVTDVVEGSLITLEGTPGDDTLDVSAETAAYEIFGYDGNDIIAGGSGDDFIYAGGDRDQLTGDGGADTFVFDYGDSFNTIQDFTANEDTIDFSAFSEFDDFADVVAASRERGGNVIINTPDGGNVKLIGVSLSDLDGDDFIFTSAAPTLHTSAFGGGSGSGDTGKFGGTILEDASISHAAFAPAGNEISGKFGADVMDDPVISHAFNGAGGWQQQGGESSGPAIQHPAELLANWELGDGGPLADLDLDISNWGHGDYLF